MDAFTYELSRREKMNRAIKGEQGFHTVHGLRNHPLYRTWQNIKSRCYNPNCKDYKYYGERGIRVCEEWEKDFVEFLYWALKHGWEKGLTIERKDFNKGYSPNNCIWIPMKEQSKNRRSVNNITYKGETHNIAEWSRITGIARKTLELRLKSPNFTIDEAFEKPANRNLARR
jgi:hypothetical protein